MTPQERQLIDELFDRLASLESGPRDPDAVGEINEGLKRAPNALYPLVQTTLVQDEALKRVDARIRELEGELGIDPAQPSGPAGFLDNMRDTLVGRREPHGSVPTVRPTATQPTMSKWRTTTAQPAGYAPPQAPESSSGSFLGTAAATAAGVVGGALLMNSMRGMFGGQQGNSGSRAFDSGKTESPWSPSTGDGNLARDAGVNDIGDGSRAATQNSAVQDNVSGSQRAGLFDTAQNDVDDTDFADDIDDSFDSGGDDDAT